MSEQKKYLDLDGLSHFWEKAKEHIEDNTVPSTRTFLGAQLNRDIDLKQLWSAMGGYQKIATEICLNPIASISQIFLHMGYINDFTIITGKVLEDLSDLYEETGEATKVILPKGTYFIKSLDQSGYLAGCWNLNTGEMITIQLTITGLEEKDENGNSYRHWYTTTSSKDINIEGIEATTIEGALAELENNSQGQWTAINNTNNTIADHQGRILNLETKIADLETVIEHGTFTSRALYTDQDNQTSGDIENYKPYLLRGTYTLNFTTGECTIAGVADKIPGWGNCWYPIPVAPISSSTYTVLDNYDNINYDIKVSLANTDLASGVVVSGAPLLELKRSDSNVMYREAANPSVEFQITYKYK